MLVFIQLSGVLRCLNSRPTVGLQNKASGKNVETYRLLVNLAEPKGSANTNKRWNLTLTITK